MDIAKLISIASQLKDVPGMVETGAAVAREIGVLVVLIKANHARAQAILSAGDQRELDAVHAETLAAIDAFDAELAKAAQS